MVMGLTACGNEAPATTEETTTTTLEEEPPTVIEIPTVDADKVIADMKAGWNLGNSLDAYSGGTPSEFAWGNPQTTQELIDGVKDAGFGTVRIPVSYMSKVGEGPDYAIDEAWLDRVQEVVDYVMNAEMYAIINIHHDGNNDTHSWIDVTAEDQTEIRAKFQKIWEQLSEHFKDYGGRLIFESMNEIMEEGNYSSNIQSTTYENINALNQIFVDTVRESGGKNTDRWLLVPGYNTNIDATMLEVGFVLPEDTTEGRLMVSVHYYDPYELCLNESSKIYKWGESAPQGFKPSWGHEDYADAQMKKLYDAYTSKGIPVILGEYGAIDKRWSNENNYEYRRYYLEYVANAAVANGVLPVYWDNGYDGRNGFSLFNRHTAQQLYPELVEAIVRGATGGAYEIALPDVVEEEITAE